MATSGQSSFSTTRNQIISHAARLCGVIRQQEVMGQAKILEFDYALNAMVKHWQGKGMRVWTVSEAVLVPQALQTIYTVSPTTTDHVCMADDFFITMTSAFEAIGQTTISVDDTSNMDIGDHIGIVVDTGVVFWSTIAAIPSLTSVTMSNALTVDASADTFVFTYTDKIPRPIKVPQDGVRRYNLLGQTIMPIRVEARQDFRWLSNPGGTGGITQVMYDKQLAEGKLTVWQTPVAITDILKFTFHRPIEDFELAGNNPDLPQEWILCLGYNLALTVAPEYGVGAQRYQMVKEQALQYLDDMTGFDREDESINFQPDMERY